MSGSTPGPVNVGGELSPMAFHVYSSVELDKATGLVNFSLVEGENTCHIARVSLQHAIKNGAASPLGDGVWRRSFLVKNTLFISSIGVEASIPECPWRDLIDRQARFVMHENGKTTVPNLYVAGTAAGYRSVNMMESPHYDEPALWEAAKKSLFSGRQGALGAKSETNDIDRRGGKHGATR